MSINLATAAVSSEPFSFFVAVDALDDELASSALAWCEALAPWSLVVAEFYEQYELDLSDATIPADMEPLRSATTLSALRHRVGVLLGLILTGPVEITLHRLVSGQRIRTHDDQLPGGPIARAIIQLNRGWHVDDGGLLLFFPSAEAEKPDRVLAPVHRSAAGFEISPCSHHAVSLVREGQRFTVVYSFHA